MRVTTTRTRCISMIKLIRRAARYIRIYGTSGSSLVLSAAEIKVQKKTDAELLISHGHLAISNSDTGIELDGTA